MRPHPKPSLLIERERAGGRDRGVRDMHARKARLEPAGGWRRRLGVADDAVYRGLLQERARLLLQRVDAIDIVPGDVARSDRRDILDDRLVGTEDREEIA